MNHRSLVQREPVKVGADSMSPFTIRYVLSIDV
jgi:hypothetical protein